jgi:hypothetical protein
MADTNNSSISVIVGLGDSSARIIPVPEEANATSITTRTRTATTDTTDINNSAAMNNGDNSNIIISNMNMPDANLEPNSDINMASNTTAATDIPIPNVNNNSNNNNASSHHAALLQQNFAIMQQNAKALQHLQQTNIFLAANPTAATTTILALNPTLLAPPIGCAAIGATSINNNPIISTISAPTTFVSLPLLVDDINDNDDNSNKKKNIDVNITESATIIEQQQQSSEKHHQQQHQSTPLISIGGAPLGDENSQLQADANTTNSTNINNVISDNNNNINNTANILRTAMMLQNNMNRKNSNNNGIIAEGNGDGDGDGAVAAANAAASVLPLAIMNMNNNDNMLSSSLSSSFPMIGGNPNILNYPNNTIIFGNNNHNINQNNFCNSAAAAAAVAASMNSGLISLRQQQQTLQQQQQQQHVRSMVHLQQHQHQPPSSSSNSVDISFDQKQQKHHQQNQKQKSKPLLSRPLYLEHDASCLTAYQCFLRKQIELFEAGHEELNGTAQGRNTPLKYGQVGIRCRHCSHLPKPLRARGGVYFSRTIDGVYQVSQNMSKIHFLQACTLVPEHTKNQLKSLQSVSSRASGGKEYWAEGLRVLGIVEEGGMLRFASNSTINEDDDH